MAPGAPQGGLVDQGARRVIGLAGAAIGAVGVGRERRDATGARERAGERQSIFLIGPAAAAPLQRDGELAARQDDGAAALGLDVAREPRMRIRRGW